MPNGDWRQYEQKYEESQRRLLGKLAAKHGFRFVSEQRRRTMPPSAEPLPQTQAYRMPNQLVGLLSPRAGPSA